MSHAHALMAIVERERLRQVAARANAHEYRGAATRDVCTECGLTQAQHSSKVGAR